MIRLFLKQTPGIFSVEQYSKSHNRMTTVVLFYFFIFISILLAHRKALEAILRATVKQLPRPATRDTISYCSVEIFSLFYMI